MLANHIEINNINNTELSASEIIKPIANKINIAMAEHDIPDAYKNKQVRTNIGLADTLIPSSFIYLIYMGGTGPCDSIKIIFGYHVNS